MLRFVGFPCLRASRSSGLTAWAGNGLHGLNAVGAKGPTDAGGKSGRLDRFGPVRGSEQPVVVESKLPIAADLDRALDLVR